MLSGDDERVVRRVGATLGIPAARCHGSVSPEDKVAEFTAAGAHGAVVMVGDDVNDVAAMAAASADPNHVPTAIWSLLRSLLFRTP